MGKQTWQHAPTARHPVLFYCNCMYTKKGCTSFYVAHELSCNHYTWSFCQVNNAEQKAFLRLKSLLSRDLCRLATCCFRNWLSCCSSSARNFHMSLSFSSSLTTSAFVLAFHTSFFFFIWRISLFGHNSSLSEDPLSDGVSVPFLGWNFIMQKMTSWIH